ncbi:hypothetical protein FACS189447_08330 [Spirochaetia bacterium]|nr:hypothetical protein FACS189447_08330 [Spirochaetia bacterium]
MDNNQETTKTERLIKKIPSKPDEVINTSDDQIKRPEEPVEKYTVPVLEYLDKVFELSHESGITDTFLANSKTQLASLSQVLDITPIQVVLFSHFLSRGNDTEIWQKEMSESLKCNNIQFLRYSDDIKSLENKRLVRCSRTINDLGIITKETYRVPASVKNALVKNEVIKTWHYANIKAEEELFDIIGDVFNQRTNGEFSFTEFYAELYDIICISQNFTFSKIIKEYGWLPSCFHEEFILLLRFSYLFIKNKDNCISIDYFAKMFETKYMVWNIERQLRNGSHLLLHYGWIEYCDNDGFPDPDHFKLTDGAKELLFSEMDITQQQKNRNSSFTSAKSISAKTLFYNKKETAQVNKLTDLLQEENFTIVQKRLSEQGLRGGFACLFYGDPGTGKTETVYQIARKTGRDIMDIDISTTKDKWFGESEKHIKQLFSQYRSCLKADALAPILFFNKADAVIGKRTEIGDANASINQTLNTIQNIILQEIEKFDGILIATTNLPQNFDKAFERRFLYKIKFAKPDLIARISIWKSIIHELPAADAETLATRFDFSGGQIENIARKCTVESIISGSEVLFEKMIAFCKEETLTEQSNPIGFRI